MTSEPVASAGPNESRRLPVLARVIPRFLRRRPRLLIGLVIGVAVCVTLHVVVIHRFLAQKFARKALSQHSAEFSFEFDRIGLNKERPIFLGLEFPESWNGDFGIDLFANIVSVDAKDVEPSELPSLLAFKSLRTLKLSGEVTPEFLQQLSTLASLRELDLDAPLTDADMYFLTGLTQLKTLRLNSSSLSDQAMEAVKEALTNCSVSFSSLLNVMDPKLLASIPALRTTHYLRVVGCTNDHQFARIMENVEMRELNLIACNISQAVVNALKSEAQLEFLTLFESPITIDQLRQLGTLQNLKSLEISPLLSKKSLRADVGQNDLPSPSAFKSLHSLKLWGEVPPEFLQQLSTIASLRELDLHATFTDADIHFLTSLTQLTTLRLISTSLLLSDRAMATVKDQLANCEVVFSPILTAEDPKLLESIAGFRTTEALRVVNCSDDDQLVRILEKVEMRELELSACNISEAVVNALKSESQLVSINLIKSPISNDHLRQLGTMQNLQSLSIDTPLSDEHLGALESLKQGAPFVELKDSRFYVSDQALEGLRQNSGRLNLHRTNDMTVDNLELPKKISGPRTVSTLVLRELTESSQMERALSFELVNLGEVRLEKCSFAPADWAALSAQRELRILTCQDTDITDEGLRHLAGLSDLTSLDLQGTSVSDEGVSLIGAQFRRLQFLNLEGTPVTGKTLSELGRLERLVSLNLNRTNITDESIDGLKAIQGLRNLYLSSTNLTDACLANLLELPVTHLVLDDTQMSPGAIVRVQNATAIRSRMRK